jgi:hypothetical protein
MLPRMKTFTMIRILFVLPVSLCCISASQPSANVQQLVVPSGYRDVPGHSEIGTDIVLVPAVRDQQFYFPSEFSNAGSEIIEIHAIAFRVQSTAAGSLDVRIPDLQFSFGVYRGPELPGAEDGPVLFLENKQIVYSGEGIRLQASPGRPASPFDVRFVFQKPYRYDRRDGYLVLESQGSTASGLYQGLDAVIDSSRGRYLHTEAGGFPNAAGTTLVTEFTIVSIPEPSSVLLMAAGAWLVLRSYHQ